MKGTNILDRSEGPAIQPIPKVHQACPYDLRKAKFYAQYRLASSQRGQLCDSDDDGDFSDFDLD